MNLVLLNSISSENVGILKWIVDGRRFIVTAFVRSI